ncbi:MAG: hypothetical protein HOO91_19870 [Bacteroidales bacterium]|nr:hypothetical protein [Bacteroidales bacterium]
MKGERVREFFNAETKSILAIYKNIETLIPSQKKTGSDHVAEEGRYIESILRSFLNKHLPKNLRAYSGFILRPATKVGDHDRTRRNDEVDRHSSQLDIIVYDSTNYPIYEQFEEFVIVPPEGVISIISVKKNLYESQLEDELKSLAEAVELCSFKNREKNIVRSPNSCLISFSNKIKIDKSFDDRCKWIFAKIKKIHTDDYFDRCIGQIISLDSFSIFKKRPNSEDNFDKKAKYLGFNHSDENEFHFGLQFLITGILSAYHHETRTDIVRPGFTSFPTNRKHDIEIGEIDLKKLR